MEKFIEQNQPRLLYSTESTFLDTSMTCVQILLQTFRNLILIAFCLNVMDSFLPFITLCNSFLVMGLLKTDMYTVNDFYYNIFNSKTDFFNIIRLMMGSSPDSDTLTQLAQYNFSSNIFSNLGGEIVLLIIALAIIVFLKVGSK